MLRRFVAEVVASGLHVCFTAYVHKGNKKSCAKDIRLHLFKMPSCVKLFIRKQYKVLKTSIKASLYEFFALTFFLYMF